MSWELPWVKRPGIHGGFVIASIHQKSDEADITDTCNDSAYVCEAHADMIVRAVNSRDELVKLLKAAVSDRDQCGLSADEMKLDWIEPARLVLARLGAL